MDREIEEALACGEDFARNNGQCEHFIHHAGIVAKAYRRLLAENEGLKENSRRSHAGCNTRILEIINRAEKAESALASMTIMRDEWRAMYAALRGGQP